MRFFVYGYGSRAHECIMERTTKAGCPEGFSRSPHDQLPDLDLSPRFRRNIVQIPVTRNE